MAKPNKAIIEFCTKYGIDQRDEIWEVHGSTWVVKHKALERVAADQGIAFDKPELKVCDLAQGLIVVLEAGYYVDDKQGRRAYSFGEATPKNCKNAYPVAMAEKRAKDRVILKLLCAHGYLYSESEADEFVEQVAAGKRQNPHVTRVEDVFDGDLDNTIPPAEYAKKTKVADQKPIWSALQNEIQATGSIEDLEAYGKKLPKDERFCSLKPDYQDFLRGVYSEHLKALQVLAEGDDMRLSA